ncbi:hypothetical protein G8C93_04610 [Cellulosimicrobium cellulans]|uniref:SUKH-4 family immunity protein n=1 Tax=Cellulosimicrobium cellulans TaxID=1710 RepID=UPI0018846331|nr:SUKH-4 family immunity protein [Cellulosimicrobium cellulans]MBE9925175.1 hypothetical protein [Cellulosimicrobium cellulans]
MRDEHLFGVRLHPVAARTDLGSGAREIGVVHDGELLVMEHEDGSIWVRDVATGDTSPLNRDRAATEGFLEAFADYLSSGQPVPGPTTMTAEQAAERLRAFRAGEVRPPSRPSGRRAPSHRARLRTLRARLRAIDSAATRPGSWWSGPLEEAENDLL